MPLRVGSSPETIQANIALLISEGRSPEEAAAIAYAQAERDLGGSCYGVEPGGVCEACGRPLGGAAEESGRWIKIKIPV